MSHHRRVRGVFAVVLIGAACILVTGCAASKPQAFATSFLPSTPLATPAAIPIEPPPHVNQNLYALKTPNLPPAIHPEIERRLKASEERFEAGKRAYQGGDAKLARTEFDRSLDILLSTPEDMPDRHRVERRLDELVDSIYRYDLDRLGAGETKQAVVYDKSPLEGMLEMTFPMDPKLTPKVTEEIQATTSQLPLEGNNTVLSYINYFSTERGRKVLLFGLRRAGRYRPLIKRIFDEEGVPQELICLAQAESAFMPRAISPKAATGIWQFMRDTGQGYGLQANNGIDERLDPEKSTRAAARMLRDLYVKFGDWYLAMAAYNCGPGCVEAAVARTGFADFWELSARNVLPRETMNYVPLILAMTIMTKNPRDYSLDNLDTDRPLEYDTVEMTAATAVDLIADAADRPVSEVKELNPALLNRLAPAGYQLHVPKGTANAVTAAIESVPEVHRTSWRMHRVQQGETLVAIAKQFNTPAESIATANNRTLEAPEAGDLLVIPAALQPDPAARRYPAPRRYTPYRAPVVAARRPAAPARTAASRVAPRALTQKAGPRVVKSASIPKRNSAQ
jgi:membrane-bound lytic murein transglycosylase D